MGCRACEHEANRLVAAFVKVCGGSVLFHGYTAAGRGTDQNVPVRGHSIIGAQNDCAACGTITQIDGTYACT
jgi:hypothetical protein